MNDLAPAAERYRAARDEFADAEAELRRAVRDADAAHPQRRSEIARRIGMSRETVRRYCRSE